jgi:hypothetical protein
MPESDNERRGVGWRTEADSDGWMWEDLHWDQRVAAYSNLALAVEALRRAVDLRDACAKSEWAGRERQENRGLTSRALYLVSVLNALFEREVAERAEALGLVMACPHGTGAEIVQHLLEAGVLMSEEYRPSN